MELKVKVVGIKEKVAEKKKKLPRQSKLFLSSAAPHTITRQCGQIQAQETCRIPYIVEQATLDCSSGMQDSWKRGNSQE